jgi:pentalenolactone synthase
MVRIQTEDPAFTDDLLGRLAAGLLFAGHETTAGRIDLGLLYLLSDLDRRDALATDPDGLAASTVEEILRMSATGGLGLLRYAHEDVEISGQLVSQGEAVIISTNSANRDPEAFEKSETFDPMRRPNAHVAFGYGGHFCIGASLARTELRVVFAALFKRLPGLRLAVGIDDIEVRENRVAGGLGALPVTW